MIEAINVIQEKLKVARLKLARTVRALAINQYKINTKIVPVGQDCLFLAGELYAKIEYYQGELQYDRVPLNKEGEELKGHNYLDVIMKDRKLYVLNVYRCNKTVFVSNVKSYSKNGQFDVLAETLEKYEDFVDLSKQEYSVMNSYFDKVEPLEVEITTERAKKLYDEVVMLQKEINKAKLILQKEEKILREKKLTKQLVNG